MFKFSKHLKKTISFPNKLFKHSKGLSNQYKPFLQSFKPHTFLSIFNFSNIENTNGTKAEDLSYTPLRGYQEILQIINKNDPKSEAFRKSLELYSSSNDLSTFTPEQAGEISQALFGIGAVVLEIQPLEALEWYSHSIRFGGHAQGKLGQNNIIAFHLMARDFVKYKELDKAVECLGIAYEAIKELSPFNSDFKGLEIQNLSLTGQVYKIGGRFAKSHEYLQKAFEALEEFPEEKSPELYEDIKFVYKNLANLIPVQDQHKYQGVKKYQFKNIKDNGESLTKEQEQFEKKRISNSLIYSTKLKELVMRRVPDSLDSLNASYMQGESFYHAQRYKEALEAMREAERIRKLHPRLPLIENLPLLELTAKIHLKLKQWKEAGSAFQQEHDIISQLFGEKSQPKAIFNLEKAKLYRETHERPEETKKCYETAIDIYKGLNSYIQVFQNAEIYSDYLHSLGQFEESVDYLKQTKEYFLKDHSDLLFAFERLHFWMARAQFDSGEIEECIENLEAARNYCEQQENISDQLYFYYYNLIICYTKTGTHQKVEELKRGYQEFIEKLHGEGAMLEGYGNLYLSMIKSAPGDFSEFVTRLKLDPL